MLEAINAFEGWRFACTVNDVTPPKAPAEPRRHPQPGLHSGATHPNS